MIYVYKLIILIYSFLVYLIFGNNYIGIEREEGVDYVFIKIDVVDGDVVLGIEIVVWIYGVLISLFIFFVVYYVFVFVWKKYMYICIEILLCNCLYIMFLFLFCMIGIGLWLENKFYN